ncbi:hypothetical protein EVAR_72956_1 [Eumeta japonica]|uniref:Uncharacterized protein n=1 Tax=Eumeta variegata TaxID=151549 RepID=A0A4C1SSR8_EUMVA|nr:hypothetical protein EVAR_72956_1 [Eumeta japonica]
MTESERFGGPLPFHLPKPPSTSLLPSPSAHSFLHQISYPIDRQRTGAHSNSYTARGARQRLDDGSLIAGPEWDVTFPRESQPRAHARAIVC